MTFWWWQLSNVWLMAAQDSDIEVRRFRKKGLALKETIVTLIKAAGQFELVDETNQAFQFDIGQ